MFDAAKGWAECGVAIAGIMLVFKTLELEDNIVWWSAGSARNGGFSWRETRDIGGSRASLDEQSELISERSRSESSASPGKLSLSTALD